jgi:hypothetical protein
MWFNFCLKRVKFHAMIYYTTRHVTSNIQLAILFCLTLFGEGYNVILFVQVSLALTRRAYSVQTLLGI